MFLRFVLTVLLIRFVSLSRPVTDDQDPLQLLLDAIAATGSEDLPPDLESGAQAHHVHDAMSSMSLVDDENAEDGNDGSSSNADEEYDAALPMKGQRVGGNHRAMIRADQKERAREYVLAHPVEKGGVLISGLRDYLGTHTAESTLHAWIREIRLEVGQAVRPPKLCAGLVRRRKKIIDAYITANSRDQNLHMIGPINAKFEAENIPTVTPVTLEGYIGRSRRRLRIPAVRNWRVNVERQTMIENFVRDHMSWTCAQSLQPIQELLRQSSIPDRAEVNLLNSIRAVKKRLEVASSTTTIRPESGDAHPGQEGGQAVARRLNPHCGVSSVTETRDPWVGEEREEELFCHSDRGTPRPASARNHRRDQIIAEYVSANRDAPNYSMENPINALLEAEGIPTLSSSSMMASIVRTRKQLNAPARPAADIGADRRAVIANYVREHRHLSDEEMLAPIRQLSEASNPRILLDYSLRRLIRAARAELHAVMPIDGTAARTTVEPRRRSCLLLETSEEMVSTAGADIDSGGIESHDDASPVARGPRRTCLKRHRSPELTDE